MNYYGIGIFGSEKDARHIAMWPWGVRLYGIEPLGSPGADGQAHFVSARTSIRSAKKLARWYAHSAARIKEIDAAVGPEAIAHHNSLSPAQKLPVELAYLDANRTHVAGLLAFYKPGDRKSRTHIRAALLGNGNFARAWRGESCALSILIRLASVTSNNGEARMYQLYFSPAARRYALDLVFAYSRGFTNRVLAPFANIEEEADAAGDKYYDKKMNEPAWDDSGLDEGEIADDAEDRSQRIYDDLAFVKREVTGLAIAGLFHLWERLVKEFLEQELIKYRSPHTLAEKVQEANFEKITKIIADCGWDISITTFYRQLDILRLIANVVKHRDGKSCNDLFAKAPDMFKPTLLKGPQPRAKNLELSRDNFCKAVDAVKEFFMEFPERVEFP